MLFNENGDFDAKEDLLKIDLLKAKNNKPFNLIDIGMKAKSFFSDFSPIEDESFSTFRTEYLNFYMVATNYLVNSLPFDVAVIKYAQYLHHDKKNSPGATNCNSNLVLKIAKVSQIFLSLSYLCHLSVVIIIRLAF